MRVVKRNYQKAGKDSFSLKLDLAFKCLSVFDFVPIACKTTSFSGEITGNILII